MTTMYAAYRSQDAVIVVFCVASVVFAKAHVGRRKDVMNRPIKRMRFRGLPFLVYCSLLARGFGEVLNFLKSSFES